MPNKSETPANAEGVGQPTSEAQLAATNGYAANVRWHCQVCEQEGYMTVPSNMGPAAMVSAAMEWHGVKSPYCSAVPEIEPHTADFRDPAS